MEMRREGGVIAWEDKEEKKKKSRYETNFNKMNFITIFYFSVELWIALGSSFKWSPVGLTQISVLMSSGKHLERQ